MGQYGNRLFGLLGIEPGNVSSLRGFANRSGVSALRLRYYNDQSKVPLGGDLTKILEATELSPAELELALHRPSRATLDELGRGAPLSGHVAAKGNVPVPAFTTKLGKLYRTDCMDVLPRLGDESVDLAFADPPFNLNKIYPSGIDDDLKEQQYLDWCELWIGELARVVKWGGSVFVWNIPRWNFLLAAILERYLTFRHWIAVDIKYSLPIQGRLYPSHYSLLYFTKGPKPAAFHPDRLPMPVCTNCLADLRDYGGYKNKMNPRGVSLTDVWLDVNPVRHRKYKRRNGANELPLALLDRVLEMASDPGDVVLDPFGGSGTTYAAAEIKGRHWIGMEIGTDRAIEERFQQLDDERAYLKEIRSGLNRLFLEDVEQRREQLGLWTHNSFA